MGTVILRKQGGSISLHVPKELVDQMALSAGMKLEASVKDSQLVFSRPDPSYSLEELLAATDSAALEAANADDVEWVESSAVGGEIL